MIIVYRCVHVQYIAYMCMDVRYITLSHCHSNSIEPELPSNRNRFRHIVIYTGTHSSLISKLMLLITLPSLLEVKSAAEPAFNIVNDESSLAVFLKP